ncbi:hypothetical protein GCM10009076_19150 [Erythrobacter ramosus]
MLFQERGCPLIARQRQQVGKGRAGEGDRVSGLAVQPWAGGIASLFSRLGQRGAKGNRHQRHIAEENAYASGLGRERCDAGAQGCGHALGPVRRVEDVRFQPYQRRTNGRVVRAGHHHDLRKVSCRNRLSRAPDHRSARHISEQFAAAKAPPRPSGEDQRRPALQVTPWLA